MNTGSVHVLPGGHSCEEAWLTGLLGPIMYVKCSFTHRLTSHNEPACVLLWHRMIDNYFERISARSRIEIEALK